MPIFPDLNRWWELNDDAAGTAVGTIGRKLWDLDLPRRTEIETNLKRFGGMSLRGRRDILSDRRTLRLNLTKSVTETLTAKVGKNRPRPTILTDGGDFALRQRGKLLQRFLDGAYQQAEIYSKTPLMFRDAMLFGTGCMHFFPHMGKKQICAERVFPTEILVDPVEAMNGAPRQILRVKTIDRGVVERMFPKKKAVVDASSFVPLEDSPQVYIEDAQSAQTMIQVFEAWYLADTDVEGNDVCGRHVIATDAGTLYADEYDEDFFPFEFFHWTKPLLGFWGDSAVGEIRGLEQEVNTLLQSVQSAMKRAGMPWCMVPDSAKVRTEKLTNEAGLLVRYQGQIPPSVQAFQPVHPQVIQQMWTLYGKAFEILGTNENQAAGIKPPGIESGRALEQLSEDHLVRFDDVSKHFEDLVGRRFARQMLRVAEELDEHCRGGEAYDEETEGEGDGKGFVLRAINNKTTLKIRWCDAKIAPDDFFMQTFPTSILPHLPSGRTQEVERWQQNQWVTPQKARQLLDFPDLAGAQDVGTADQDLLEWQLDQMLQSGKDIAPEPRQDLQNAMQWGTYCLELGMRDGTPEAHLDKLRTFLNAIDDLTQQATQAAQAQPGMPPGMPPDGGMPALPPGLEGPPGLAGMPGGAPGGPPGMQPGMPPS
jgi:hypothetical protein